MVDRHPLPDGRGSDGTLSFGTAVCGQSGGNRAQGSQDCRTTLLSPGARVSFSRAACITGAASRLALGSRTLAGSGESVEAAAFDVLHREIGMPPTARHQRWERCWCGARPAAVLAHGCRRSWFLQRTRDPCSRSRLLDHSTPGRETPRSTRIVRSRSTARVISLAGCSFGLLAEVGPFPIHI